MPQSGKIYGITELNKYVEARKMRILPLIMGLLFTTTILAEIKEIHELSDLLEVIAPGTSNEWVLFDVDYTLTAPDHPMLQMNVIKENKKLFREELEKFVGDEKMLVPGLMVTQAPNKLLDIKAPQVIQKIISMHATVFGFTAIDTAKLPDVGDVPAWRLNELERLGIHFSNLTNSSLPAEKIEFVEFSPFRGSYPLYDQGILYANVTASKGAVLKAFIDSIASRPTRVILIDDTLENLQKVEQELDLMNIPFIGLHYVPKQECTPQFSEEQWRAVWDSIKKRARNATISADCL